MVPGIDPDVVILDIKMPGLNGIEAARKIREQNKNIGIILLSSYEDAEYITEFLKEDPRGKAYLLKRTLATVDELRRTIRDVAAGRTILEPVMVDRLTEQTGAPKNFTLRELTPREMEVLSLISKACSNQTIARILYIEQKTVEHHINSIFSKLNATLENGQHSRVRAVLAYLEGTGLASALDASLRSA